MNMAARVVVLETALRAILESLAEGEFTEDNGNVCYIVEANDVALAKAQAAAAAAAVAELEPEEEEEDPRPDSLEDYLIDIWRALD